MTQPTKCGLYNEDPGGILDNPEEKKQDLASTFFFNSCSVQVTIKHHFFLELVSNCVYIYIYTYIYKICVYQTWWPHNEDIIDMVRSWIILVEE